MAAASFRAGTTATTRGHALGGSCFAVSSSNARRRQNAPRAHARYSQMASEMEATASSVNGTGHFALSARQAATVILKLPDEVAEGHQFKRCLGFLLVLEVGVEVLRASSSDALRMTRSRERSRGYAKSSARIGRRRRRLPVAAKAALQTAGATTGKPGSPIPVGFSLLITRYTSILGISLMRGMS